MYRRYVHSEPKKSQKIHQVVGIQYRQKLNTMYRRQVLLFTPKKSQKIQQVVGIQYRQKLNIMYRRQVLLFSLHQKKSQKIQQEVGNRYLVPLEIEHNVPQVGIKTKKSQKNTVPIASIPGLVVIVHNSPKFVSLRPEKKFFIVRT